MSRSSRHRANRVLHPIEITSLDAYLNCGGGRGLCAALSQDPNAVIEMVTQSGLRGRGGAGFPVGRKWATVADNCRNGQASPAVVVNGAEGEPGTFKDRSIIRSNPYQLVEGALIAAHAVRAKRIVLATKASFAREVTALRAAIGAMRKAGMIGASIEISVFEGPDEYLFGEESALLETIDGHGPFPRVTPPYRIGLTSRCRDGEQPGPALVNNVESIANLPKIVARGPEWFRRVGTDESPGTVVCTVTGDTRHHGVGEVRFGTPLRRVIRSVGGGPRPGAPIKAVMSGVANPVIRRDQLGTRVSHEAMREIGCGLGSCGFIVFDSNQDMVAVAAGIARFLSVESCGQCTPCKSDGLALSSLLERLARNDADAFDLAQIRRKIDTVAFGARCYLGVQQETVLRSLLQTFGDEFDRHLDGSLPAAPPVLISELVDIGDGVAVLDEHHRTKQPDWTHNCTDSGSVPAEVRARRSPRPPQS